MSQRELDEALAKVRGEQPDDQVVRAAAGRVFRNLFDSNFITAEPSAKIRGCADVRALIPAYLNRSLPEARVLLLEDHVLTCVACRQALQEARTGAPSVRPIPVHRPRRQGIPAFAWAAAATLLVGIGLGLTGRFPGQTVLRAQVESVQGSLYKVTDIGVSLLKAGDIIKNTDELRTAKGSHAILRLAGSTMVEIAERSEVSVSGGWRGTSLNLSRGQMIVDTHNQLQKAMYVSSGDMTIPITNGIVAVDHGTKDSQVAVAKGSVDVSVGSDTHHVSAGQHYGGRLQLISLPIASEFAWSQNAASYNDLLSQFSGLQKDIQALPSVSLRYASNLAPYLPADTFVYVAVPNMGGTITQAKKLFDSRLAESEALRQWWQQQSISKNGAFDKIVEQISSFSGYLGDEIVVSVSGNAAASDAGPVFIAEIKQPGLAEYLQANLPANAQIQIVAPGSPIEDGSKLLIEIDNNILVATPNAAQLKRVEDVVHKVTPSAFTATPFFARIGKVYQNGAGTFLAANLEQITAKSVTNSKTALPVGLDNVQYLVLERKGDGEMRASLSFEGARQGVASWLAAPGPAGSLNFVSPDANFAASIVMKSPKVMMQELLGLASGNDSSFTQELDRFQAQSGINVLDDVAGPLGNDVTLAMDGPLTPILAIEVFDPNHLQQTLRVFVDKWNQQDTAGTRHLTLTSADVNGRAFFSISNAKSPNFAAWYTFVDGYLVASSSQANVITAIGNKQSGHALANSDTFRSKLPADGYSNFSAMVYANLSQLGSVAKQFDGSNKKNAVLGYIANSGPSLICVYGEPDHITAATKNSFLGFDLGTLVGLQQGKPLQTMIAKAPVGVKKGNTQLSMQPVIELNALSVKLGNHEVLREITSSFTGRTIGLLGPNGAGKSTLISTLLGFWPITSGSARILGHDVARESKQIRALVGYMPENDSFIGSMTAVAFICLMAELSGLPAEMALERAHEALFYVGLGEARYRTLGTYSLGMKQLAKLAQAIVHGPKLVILDEPTNGLDPPARQRMIRLVREMRDTGEMHIVLCSHLLRDVEETCEEVVILKKGKVVHYSNLENERKLNKKFVELELRGDMDKFVAAVESLGCESAPGAMNRLKLVLGGNTEVSDIYRVAAEQNVQLRRMNFRRDTLEEIFLKAMENNNGSL